MRRALMVVVALAVLLSGCARGEPAGPVKTLAPLETASSPSPTPTAAESAACTFLTAKERRSIAGAPIDLVVLSNIPKDSEQCRWQKDASAATTMLQVTVSPAREWSRRMPTFVDAAIKSGRVTSEATRDRLRAAKKRVGEPPALTDKQACDMFSLIAEVNGQKKDASQVLSYGTFGAQVSAKGVMCSKGVLTSLTYSEFGLTRSTSVALAVLRLLEIAHKRAVKNR